MSEIIWRVRWSWVPACAGTTGNTGTISTSRRHVDRRGRRLGGRHHELRARQLGEHAVGGHQLLERATLDDVSATEHQDAVGMADGGEPMRDHEGGAVL